jgi:beta-lactamase regulating signal transducer with metallopeptidase domain
MNDAEFFSTLLITHIVQFSIVILAAGVIVRLTGRRWPHFAFLICMVALLKSLMPPVLSSPTGLFSINPALALSTEVRVATLYDKIRQSGSPIREVVSSDPGSGMPEATIDLTTSLRAAAGFESLPWFQILACIWVAGALFVLGRAWWQIARFRRLIRTRRCRVPGAVNVMIREIRRDLSLRRGVDVLISESNDGPAIVGVIRPVLVLPRVLVSHSTGSQLRPIIAHELIHARRGDAIWGLLQFCAEVVWWFHPFVWWLGRRANMLCERCCDEEAIAGLQCSAADYAESLVRVLAMRNVLRPAPCGKSMRASDVTGQRLERLMKRCGRYCARTPGAAWLVMMGLALMLLPGAAWGDADEAVPEKTPIDVHQNINDALQSEDWESAVKFLRMAVAADADDARATFMLGYVLHMQGHHEEALGWHQKATKFKQVRATALYNCACVLALTGKHAEALDELQAAIDAGFRYQTDIADDPDLESLVESERFQQLRTRALRTSGNDTRRAFDFWVGKWNVVDSTGKSLGVNVISKNENGYLLTEKWHDSQGGSGTSVNFFDPADKMWHQIWVDSKGSVIRFKGAWKNDRMELSGTSVDAAGKSKSVTMTLTPQQDRTVRQQIEESKDGGTTWSTLFEGVYHPRTETALETVEAVLHTTEKNLFK